MQYAVPRRGLPGAAALRAWARAAFSPAGALAITIRIVGSREGRRLNHAYRKRDYATNVLSFDTGDIALCHPVIVREAQAQGKSVRAHYAHLVIHGVLHLRGHAHGKRMEHYEIRMLRRFGFADPYAVK